jgi:hypothetical protein
MAKFTYENCLDREYENSKQLYVHITFDISRYGKYTRTITFNTPLTEKEAVREAESYLSVPIDRDYYNLIRDVGDGRDSTNIHTKRLLKNLRLAVTA